MKFIDILRDHLDAFNQAYDGQITASMRQAINAMLSCRTHTQRVSHWACQGCTQTADFPLSCGHRSCPQCQYNTTADWLAKQQAKLLPVDYFMVTFTLPFELRVIAKLQPEQLYQAMCSVAASVLKDFALNSPKFAGDIGFTGVLHTHSRRRDLHPHVHFIIPAGSFNKTKQHWKKIRVNSCSMPLTSPKSGVHVCWNIWQNLISNCQPHYRKSGWWTASMWVKVCLHYNIYHAIFIVAYCLTKIS
jgi:hypothetical protein